MIHVTDFQTSPKILKKISKSLKNLWKASKVSIQGQNSWRWEHWPAPPSIITKLWYCDITRRPDIVTEQECAHALSTRPRLSHALKKDKSVRSAALQARKYQSESG